MILGRPRDVQFKVLSLPWNMAPDFKCKNRKKTGEKHHLAYCMYAIKTYFQLTSNHN